MFDASEADTPNRGIVGLRLPEQGLNRRKELRAGVDATTALIEHGQLVTSEAPVSLAVGVVDAVLDNGEDLAARVRTDRAVSMQLHGEASIAIVAMKVAVWNARRAGNRIGTHSSAARETSKKSEG